MKKIKLPDDTIQGEYRRTYKPLGIKKREVAAHGAMTAVVIIGCVPIGSAILSVAKDPLTGCLLSLALGWGFWQVLKMIDGSDPAVVKKRENAKRDEIRIELLQEIRDGKYLS